MNNHYIPRLLLKQFAVSNKVNTYDCAAASFQTQKLKNTFVSKDIFDKDLEAAFAIKLEGPFGDLLNHKLLRGDTISIDRTENMLMRKFLMIQALRSPFSNCSWDEMVRRTQTQDHPSMQAMEFLKSHNPEWTHVFERSLPSAETYIPVLRKAMEFDSIEDIANADARVYVPETLRYAARHAIVTVVAFWDTSQSGQEFLLPKLPGISQMDQVSIFYKRSVIENLRKQWERKGLKDDLRMALDRLLLGSLAYPDNFSIYPLSPTRAMICFSPYFRAFFPNANLAYPKQRYPALLEKEQFDRHFFEPMRMELFRPCKNACNKFYQYDVKQLYAEEVQSINALLINMETEEFVFRDFNKIRDSFWYYDKKAKFAQKKKHDFSRLV